MVCTAINQGFAIAGEIEIAHPIDEAFALIVLEVVGINDSSGIMRAERIMKRAFDGVGEEQRLAFDTAYLAETSFADRERQDTLADPFQIDGDRFRLFLIFFLPVTLLRSILALRRGVLLLLLTLWLFLLLFLLFVFTVRSFGHRNKGRELIALQQDRIGLDAAWKTEIKLDSIIDRIEDTHTQK